MSRFLQQKPGNWLLLLVTSSQHRRDHVVCTHREMGERSNYTRFKNIDRKQGVRRSNLTSIFQGQFEFVLIL